VYQAENVQTGEFVAVKVLDKHATKIGVLEREILIMKNLSHRCLTGLIDVFQSEDEIFMVIEYVRGGDIYARLMNAEAFSEKVRRRRTRESASKFFRHSSSCSSPSIQLSIGCVAYHKAIV
jgi:serine/threonine protein kinase